MKRRNALYLIIALALSLAPIAAFAAPPSLALGAAGVNLANLQPAAPEKPSSLACASLDNPKIRPLMSGMYETSLLIACGRQDELGQVKSAPIARPQNGEAPELGTDVLVNNPALDTSGTTHTQSETTLARNETTGTLCSAYNNSYSGVTLGTGFVGFSRSTDDGATFTDNGVVPPAGGGQSRGDPSLVWRKSDGHFYFTSLHTYGLGLWKSTTDCASLTWVGMAHSGAHDDKELMAVDNNVASPYYGRLYIAYIDFTDSRIRSIYSTNGGTTWSAPVILSGAGVNVQGAWPTVGPDGDLLRRVGALEPLPQRPDQHRDRSLDQRRHGLCACHQPADRRHQPAGVRSDRHLRTAGVERQHPLPALAADCRDSQRRPARSLCARPRRSQHRRRDQRLLPPLDRQRRHLGGGNPAERRRHHAGPVLPDHQRRPNRPRGLDLVRPATGRQQPALRLLHADLERRRRHLAAQPARERRLLAGLPRPIPGNLLPRRL